MVHKFTDWKSYDPQAVLFNNVCSLMHDAQFTWQGKNWRFHHNTECDQSELSGEQALKINCRIDRLRCKLYFLMEDINFLLRHHYEADVSLLGRAMQPLLLRQAIGDLLGTGQNIALVQDISLMNLSPGMMKSSRQYLCASIDLYINTIRLRGLMKLSYDDVKIYFALYQKYIGYIRSSNAWQDTPLVFSVLLGDTMFEVSDFMSDRYNIREHDVIIIERTPPQGCVWIDIGGYLLLARYDQKQFILEEEIIMPDDTKQGTQDTGPAGGKDEYQTLKKTDESGPEEQEEQEEQGEQPQEGTEERGPESSQETQEQEGTEEREEPEESEEPREREEPEEPKGGPKEGQEMPGAEPEEGAEDSGLGEEAESSEPGQAMETADADLPTVTSHKLSHTSLKTAIKKMSVHVIFELSRIQIPLSDLQRLNKGYVFNLHQKDNTGINIIVNEKIVARGELVKIADSLGVRITKVF